MHFLHIRQSILPFESVKRVSDASDRQALASLLRQMRVDAGLRQVDLARALGEPQSYVSRYESGEQRLDLIEVRTVCRAMGLSLAELIRTFEDIVR
jgi:transcriptional regulator with XRE-family HTH domain